jgi:hypothetical protein
MQLMSAGRGKYHPQVQVPIYLVSDTGIDKKNVIRLADALKLSFM